MAPPGEDADKEGSGIPDFAFLDVDPLPRTGFTCKRCS
jgi:hypothetical protein